MMWGWRQHDGPDDAPLQAAAADSATLQFSSDPPLGFDPRFAGRAVDTPWLAALLLMAVVAGALLGALWNSLRVTSPDVAAPSLFARVTATAEGLARTDRLALPVAEISDLIRSRIEQLDDEGANAKPSTRVFTHVVARLASASEHVAAPPVSADALPREIRFGMSHPPPEARPSFYASVEEPSLASSVHVKSETPPLGEPINLTVIAKAARAARPERRVVVARAGDTLPTILAALGTPAEDAAAITALLTPHRWFGRNEFEGGETVIVVEDGNNRDAVRRPQSVSLTRGEAAERLAVLTDAGRYVAIAPVARSALRHGPTRHAALSEAPPATPSRLKLQASLKQLAKDRRVAPVLVEAMLKLCAEDVDLDAAISTRDAAEFLYSRDARGEPELAFAALTLDGRSHRYYRFTTADDGSTDYYDADGHSVTAWLMNKPVAEGQLGDGFGWRVHPILRDRRFHEGVDYAAPLGSPVVAAGAGVVDKIGFESGYGKFVRIRHDYGYETTYAHISGSARGLRVGERVRRGQTIAYIGSTGLSTGPHLYYELRVGDRYEDPLHARLRAGRVLDGDVLAAFEKTRDRTDLLLQASAQGE
jgi:murein DD-endopeptidase MepM/ murein hydrolase activator NlpD